MPEHIAHRFTQPTVRFNYLLLNLLGEPSLQFCHFRSTAGLMPLESFLINLLGWFDCELAKDPPAPTWSRAGSLESTRDWLIDALSVLSGHSPEAIADSLAESRIDTEPQA